MGRKPAQAKPADEKVEADQNSATEGGDTGASDSAPAVEPPSATASPEDAGEDSVQTVAEEASASSEAKEPADDTDPSPVSGPVLVVTGPKKGRRRAGMVFGREPKRLTPSDFEDSREGAECMLAILSDPALTCVFVDEDGNEVAAAGDVAVQLRERIEATLSEAKD